MKKTLPISNEILNEALLKYQIERIEEKYPFTDKNNALFKPDNLTDEKINKLIRIEKKPYYVLINTVGKRVA